MSDLQSTYRIVFWGEVTLGHERATVEQQFAKWFKISDKRLLDKLFSGRLLTLKKGLSHRDAKLYCALIRGLGATCRLERERGPVAVPSRRIAVRQGGTETVVTATERPELRLVQENEYADEDYADNPFAARDLGARSYLPRRPISTRVASRRT